MRQSFLDIFYKVNKAVNPAFIAIDREETSRGLLAIAENLIVKDAEGNIVCDMFYKLGPFLLSRLNEVRRLTRNEILLRFP